MKKTLQLLAPLLLLLLWTGNAWAACTSPAGVAGGREWFSADKNYRFCNGTSWVLFGTTALSPPLTLYAGSGVGNTTCGIQPSGTAYCWGDDANEELGDGTGPADQVSPVTVSGGYAWKSIAPSLTHSCGITTAGDAYCWGTDGSGQLGNGATTGTQTTPSAVSGGLKWKWIVTGNYHSCGITTAGAAYCWGDDSFERLGNGTGNTQQTSPGAVAGGGTWSKIATADAHSCGLQTNGTIYCWGDETYGRLGDGSTSGTVGTPAAVAGSWIDVATGLNHSCGITSGGAAYCWGNDNNGQLGNGATTGDQSSPSLVSGGFTWTAIAAGNVHTCAIRSTGAMYCWGSDNAGQQGNGATTGDQASPNLVSGGYTWIAVAAGSTHTCGITSAYALMCWGSDSDGQVGNGATTGNQTSPVAVTSVGSNTWIDGKSCSNTGELDYLTTDLNYQLCNGTALMTITCPSGNCGSLGACTGSGKVDYFSGTGELAWCNGSSWQVMSR